MLSKSHGPRPGQSRSDRPHPRKPAAPRWADGLRKLYDDVVSEPLPDSFNDLLKKLDRADDD
ncbi:NepR family anti-sigma factor [Novosphingobium sp. NPDC080210]|uniref:NepR family anti-sigma factor n=1 Tax=unclassified Novosphingobium TaxID=2644732 RepID=UPI0035B4EDAA